MIHTDAIDLARPLDTIDGRPASLLDRIHQAMVLWHARHDDLEAFLRRVGTPRFWDALQALCALYPRGSDERRLAEGLIGSLAARRARQQEDG